MNRSNIYYFVIDSNFINRVNRAFIILFLCLAFMLFFSYYVFTSNAWAVQIFGVKISTYYLPPIISLAVVSIEEIALLINYGRKSFKTISIVDSTIKGKGFLNQKIMIDNPIILDWDYSIKKNWIITKKDPILSVSFIKLTNGHSIFFIPHSKADKNFISHLESVAK
ncbi:hypothetical protein LU293_03385 [Moraxella nasovis]|uniref:hypothetical protein n=1 Tax=Moraxella nasovis TaxID=2904121 RepID=UPI001F625933|nr:hypothetical protein [Moraxella nasovis]UNU73952.1 hypothetical protein LU293_03385 [Moraxella nasovis]